MNSNKKRNCRANDYLWMDWTEEIYSGLPTALNSMPLTELKRGSMYSTVKPLLTAATRDAGRLMAHVAGFKVAGMSVDVALTTCGHWPHALLRP